MRWITTCPLPYRPRCSTGVAAGQSKEGESRPSDARAGDARHTAAMSPGPARAPDGARHRFAPLSHPRRVCNGQRLRCRQRPQWPCSPCCMKAALTRHGAPEASPASVTICGVIAVSQAPVVQEGGCTGRRAEEGARGGPPCTWDASVHPKGERLRKPSPPARIFSSLWQDQTLASWNNASLGLSPHARASFGLWSGLRSPWVSSTRTWKNCCVMC